MNSEQPNTLRETCDALNLTIRSEFIPWSESRNAKEKQPSLNWKVTLVCNSRDVITTDYMAGLCHCDYYAIGSFGRGPSVDTMIACKKECETGLGKGARRHTPSREDVVYSLVSDASAIDHSTFESWADDYGYDHDSRSAEAIYRECLKIGLALRAALGDAALSQLRDACQNY